jgi:hypothetical protein
VALAQCRLRRRLEKDDFVLDPPSIEYEFEFQTRILGGLPLRVIEMPKGD